MAIAAYKGVFNQANIVSIPDFLVCEASDRGQDDEETQDWLFQELQQAAPAITVGWVQ